MQETGVHNGAFGADKFGLTNLKQLYWNLGAPQLYQYSLSVQSGASQQRRERLPAKPRLCLRDLDDAARFKPM